MDIGHTYVIWVIDWVHEWVSDSLWVFKIEVEWVSEHQNHIIYKRKAPTGVCALGVLHSSSWKQNKTKLYIFKHQDSNKKNAVMNMPLKSSMYCIFKHKMRVQP